ncbi:MAG: GTPase, partial [Thermoanaerobaculia bacterium]
ATGEEVVEFFCHGSPAIVAALISAARHAGARPASAGEFTRRALAHGKLDLAAAEGIAELVGAESRQAARRSLGLVEGALSGRVHAVKGQLLALLAELEAGLDYAEDVPAIPAARVLDTLRAARREIEALLESSAGSRRDHLPTVVILGRPNAGKSTLFNALLGFDRAIVTAVPGTTRDALTESIALGRVSARLVDTAGLRETADEVERLGVQVAQRAGAGADLILYVVEAVEADAQESAGPGARDESIARRTGNRGNDSGLCFASEPGARGARGSGIGNLSDSGVGDASDSQIGHAEKPDDRVASGPFSFESADAARTNESPDVGASIDGGDFLAGFAPSIRERMLVVRTKCDLLTGRKAEGTRFRAHHEVSALTGLGLIGLREAVESRLIAQESEGELLVLERHRAALSRTRAALCEACDFAGEPRDEFVAACLRQSLHALGEITGETATEELLDLIFSTFCLGK